MLSRPRLVASYEPLQRQLHKAPNCDQGSNTKPARDTFIDTLYGPTATVHRLTSLRTWATATRAKIRAETAA